MPSASSSTFLQALRATTPLEMAGVLTGVACVWLAAVSSVWNFPVAMLSCGLYLVVFGRARLYADTGLQLVFLLLAGWGWYQWAVAAPGQAALPITHARPADFLVLGGAVLAFTAVAGFLFRKYTDAALPYWDSGTTAVSLAAQVLLAQRKLENWHLWVAVDVVYVLIYWRRRLYFTSLLYGVLAGLAVYGGWQWQQELSAAEAAPHHLRPTPSL